MEAAWTSARTTTAKPINPQRVFWELSPRLPDGAILPSDSGSSANWFARDIKIRDGMMASLSGNLATMGPGVPYAIAAKFALSRSPGDRARRRRRDADERHQRADHHREVLEGVARPALGRAGAQQPRPQPGHLGACARWPADPNVPATQDAARLRLRALRRAARAAAAYAWTSPTASGAAWDEALAARSAGRDRGDGRSRTCRRCRRTSRSSRRSRSPRRCSRATRRAVAASSSRRSAPCSRDGRSTSAWRAARDPIDALDVAAYTHPDRHARVGRHVRVGRDHARRRRGAAGGRAGSATRTPTRRRRALVARQAARRGRAGATRWTSRARSRRWRARVRNLGRAGIASMAISRRRRGAVGSQGAAPRRPARRRCSARCATRRRSTERRLHARTPTTRCGAARADGSTEGIGRVKMKVGREPERDARASRRRARRSAPRRAVRRRQRRLHAQAGAALGEAFAESGVRWFEEPVSSDDLDGPAAAARRAPAGWTWPPASTATRRGTSARMLEAGAVDVLQADATRCGGYTGFSAAAALCDAYGLAAVGALRAVAARARRVRGRAARAHGVVPRSRAHRAHAARRLRAARRRRGPARSRAPGPWLRVEGQGRRKIPRLAVPAASGGSRRPT